MRIDDNGTVRDMTAEEEAAYLAVLARGQEVEP